MRFLGVGVWLMLFVVGGVGVAPLVAAAAEPQAAAPVAAAEKEKPQNEKSVAEQIPWPEQRELPMLKPIRLFMTEEEVHWMWGEPEKYFYMHVDRDPSKTMFKYFPPSRYEEALKQYGSLWDVYYRNTATNRYEVRIEYREGTKVRLLSGPSP